MYAYNEHELEMEFEHEGELEHEGEHELEMEFEHEGELEHEGEFEGELEHEGEQFLGGMLGGLLGEGEGELEHELHEHELHEHEAELHEVHEHEHEAEQFFGRLARVAARAQKVPALRRLGIQAARRVLANDRAFEGEGEAEGELELEINPVRKVYLDAMMEHMGHAAAEAETEQEAAEAFLPLIPLAMKALPLVGKLAAKVVPKLAPKLFQGAMRVMPRLTRGISQVARTLHRDPRTRALLRAVPQIAQRTTARIGRQLAAGRPVTPRSAARVLAQQTARVLGDPRQLVHAWRRSRMLDRSHHRHHPGAMRRRRRSFHRGHHPWSSPGGTPPPVASHPHGVPLPPHGAGHPGAGHPGAGHPGAGHPGAGHPGAYGPVCAYGHPITLTCHTCGR